jgi:hypothetical protein
MQPEQLRFLAWQVGSQEREANTSEVAEALENAADYIDSLRDLSARLASDEDKSGYHPFVASADPGEVLVSIFTEPDGQVGLVQLAFRVKEWDSWSPPIEAVRR